MYKLRKLLIALDLSDVDNDVIRYAFAVSKIINVGKMHFYHAVIGGEQYIDSSRAYMEEKISKIEDEVGEGKHDVEIIVEQSDPLTGILNTSKHLDIDLIVIGRKNVNLESGRLTKTLARRALCSVLSVPQSSKPEFKKLLLPIDYSKYSKFAMNRALDYGTKLDLEIVCLNVYDLPNGYLSSGKSEGEYAEIMKANSEKRFKLFIKEFETEHVVISPKYYLDKSNSIEKIIFNIGLVEDADLIIMGSRGRTDIAAAFLGSTTEKLLLHNICIPTLVLKNKDANLGFFDALLNI